MAHPNRGREWPIDQIRSWIAEDRTHRWIADQLGTTDQRISTLCRKHGIAVKPRGPRPGAGHPDWKGGRIRDADGYILVWVEQHPHAKRRPGQRHPGGYVREHRLVMEAHLGRHLLPTEVVHHLNNLNDDNSIENLELFQSNADHLRHELTGRCPAWTDAGKERIREGCRRAAARRRAAIAGDG